MQTKNINKQKTNSKGKNNLKFITPEKIKHANIIRNGTNRKQLSDI